MNCRKVSSLFVNYFEKQLDKKQANEVFSHLQNCSDCSKAFDFITNSMNSVMHFKDSKPEVTDFFTERTLAKIQSHSDKGFSTVGWITSVLFRRNSVLAASIAAAFTGVIFGILLNFSSAQINESEASAEIQTVEEIYLAGTSNDYMIRFFDNQYYKENGNE